MGAIQTAAWFELLAGAFAVWLTYRTARDLFMEMNPSRTKNWSTVRDAIRVLVRFTVLVAFTQWSLGTLEAAVAGGIALLFAVAPWHITRNPEPGRPAGPEVYGYAEPIPTELAADDRDAGHGQHGPMNDYALTDSSADETGCVEEPEPSTVPQRNPALTRNEQEEFDAIVRGFGKD